MTKTNPEQVKVEYKCLGYLWPILGDRVNQHGVTIEALRNLVVRRFGEEVSVQSIDSALTHLEPFITRQGETIIPARELLSAGRSSFFDSRADSSRGEKRAVAKYIHEQLLNELEAIFLDAGSANYAIADEMVRGNKRNFTVMTNNMRAIRTLLGNPTIRIFVTGGSYDVSDEALVGKGAQFDFSWFNCRTAIVGASAITAFHVYNHAIAGEEEIKKYYWQIPANQLIIPATLAKFGGRDVSCFGELFPHRNNRDHRDSASRNLLSIYDAAEEEVGDVREEYRKRLFGNELQEGVPGFGARRCKIVIEPEWMIDEQYDKMPGIRDELMRSVRTINQNTAVSEVEVVMAKVSRKELETA